MKSVVQRVLRERYAALANKSERATAKLAREDAADDDSILRPLSYDEPKIIFGMDVARGLEETAIWYMDYEGLIGIDHAGRRIDAIVQDVMQGYFDALQRRLHDEIIAALRNSVEQDINSRRDWLKMIEMGQATCGIGGLKSS